MIPVVLPTVAAPIVRPVTVMVKAVAAGMPIPPMVMTIEVAVGADAVAVMVATDAAPEKKVGVADAAKNPDG